MPTEAQFRDKTAHHHLQYHPLSEWMQSVQSIWHACPPAKGDTSLAGLPPQAAASQARGPSTAPARRANVVLAVPPLPWLEGHASPCTRP